MDAKEQTSKTYWVLFFICCWKPAALILCLFSLAIPLTLGQDLKTHGREEVLLNGGSAFVTPSTDPMRSTSEAWLDPHLFINKSVHNLATGLGRCSGSNPGSIVSNSHPKLYSLLKERKPPARNCQGVQRFGPLNCPYSRRCPSTERWSSNASNWGQ